MFAQREVEWKEVAITRGQFLRMKDQFGWPVKEKDKLAPAFIERYGKYGVEVDAIPSDGVRELFEKAILERIDMKLWEAPKAIEEKERQKLKRLVSKMK